jgi:CelD/BcsL family acetyltransferase involved in cellulose biosynthesis
MTRIRLLVHSGPAVFRDHAGAWDDLLQRCGEPSFFLRSAWLRSWAEVFGEDHELFLLVAERDGEWVAGMPLAQGLGRLGSRREVAKLEFAGAPYFDRMEILATDHAARVDFLAEVLDWSRREREGWIALALEELPRESGTLRALAELQDAGTLRHYTQLASRAPLIELEAPEQRPNDRYLRKIRRNRAKLEQLGGVEVRLHRPEPSEVHTLVAEMSDVEDRSWKGAQGVGVFRTGRPFEFFSRVWTESCAEGRILAATIRHEGELVAYHWGFLHGERYLAYNLAQLPGQDEFTAGLILLEEIVQGGGEHGFRVVDASRGSLDKQNFIGAYHGPVREHGHATIYHPGARGQAMRLLRHRVFPVARAVLGKPQPPALSMSRSGV